MINNYQIKVIAAGAVIAALATGCEFSIGGESADQAAVKLIEGEFATNIGFDVTANCPPVDSQEIGTTFSCTATTAEGETIQIAGEIDAEDHINVWSTNLLLPDDLDALEKAGAETLEPEIQAQLKIECSSEPVILGSNSELTCLGTDEFNNQADIIFTITDTQTGDFQVRVG